MLPHIKPCFFRQGHQQLTRALLWLPVYHRGKETGLRTVHGASSVYTLLIREMAGLLLEHRRKSEDVFAHGVGVDHLMEAMLVEIACADIDSRSIQMRRDHRNVTERSIVLFKAEAANELRKIGVITVVEHGVIRAAPIQLNDIVDLRPQLALGEFPRAHTADLFLFTKKDMAPTLAHQQ